VAVKEIAEALVRQGHEVHLVVYDHGRHDASVDSEVQIHRAPHLPLGKQLVPGPSLRKPFWDALLTWRLFQVVRQYDIEIIHAHNYEAPIAGYIVRRMTGVPVIYHAHNTMASELYTYTGSPWMRKSLQHLAAFLDNQVPTRADFVITITEEILSFLLQRGVAPDKVVYIPLGVDFAPFARARSGVLDHDYKLKNRLKVVYTGTINEYQEIDHLIAAFRQVQRQVPESVLVMAGQVVSPKDYSLYGQFLSREDVCFIDDPSFEQTIDILADADVTVVPRILCPGMPVKLLNYMVAGKPTVAFEGSAKGLRHMENGVTVKDGDIDAFANGIVRLLRDRSLAKRLGSQARQTAQKEYSWPTIARQISAIYDQVLAQRRLSG